MRGVGMKSVGLQQFNDSKMSYVMAFSLNVYYIVISHTLPETNIYHLKIDHPKRKLVFQPSIFSCCVSFRECISFSAMGLIHGWMCHSCGVFFCWQDRLTVRAFWNYMSDNRILYSLFGKFRIGLGQTLTLLDLTYRIMYVQILIVLFIYMQWMYTHMQYLLDATYMFNLCTILAVLEKYK